MKKRYFKILNTKTGLYRKVGSYEEWSKTGKIWSGTGALNNHFALYQPEQLKKMYRDCVVEEYEMVPIGNLNVLEFIEGVQMRKEKKAKAYKEYYEKRTREEELKLLKSLQAKYNNELK